MPSSSSHPPRIVVVEDNAAEVRLLRQALTETGEPFHLEVLSDGKAALRYVRERCDAPPTPCLIVLDLHLPAHDGATILRAIREEPVLSHVHVAVLTTIASPAEEAEVRQLGVCLYRRKPVDFDQLLELAAELMAICKGQTAAAAS